ncbi:MAG: fasciclin domain-containing protein [Cytophagales bacterium]|nr:MAG: fasciclin domain-containing protein [Cytophagales bacterium]
MKKIIVLLCALCLCSFANVQAQGQLLKQGVKQMAITALMTQLQSNPKLSKFATLFQAAQVAGLLGSQKSPLTLLAPSNSAIDAAFSKDQLQNLLKPESKSMLGDLVKNHLISGAMSAANLGGTSSSTNLLGKALNIAKLAGGALSIGGANVTDTDIKTSDGSMIQVIDKVLTTN